MKTMGQSERLSTQLEAVLSREAISPILKQALRAAMEHPEEVMKGLRLLKRREENYRGDDKYQKYLESLLSLQIASDDIEKPDYDHKLKKAKKLELAKQADVLAKKIIADNDSYGINTRGHIRGLLRSIWSFTREMGADFDFYDIGSMTKS